MSSICEDKMMREFWVKCTDQNSLYIHPDRLLNMLEQKFSSVIAEKHMIDPVKGENEMLSPLMCIRDIFQLHLSLFSIHLSFVS